MDEPDFKQSKVAIMGLGLMGGSLALALRGHCELLLGVDPDPQACEYAYQNNIVDEASTNPEELIPQADVIFLAAPVGAILGIIADLPSLHPGHPLIIDIGSTKTIILDALQKLPPRFDVLGGHPICGKEKLSIINADGKIFKGKTFVFSPLPRTSKNARRFADHLCAIIGANPLSLSPNDHDIGLAATSHLPYLVSTALVLSTSIEFQQFVGPGFRSATRLAVTPSSMMLDILATNSENILGALEQFQINLEILKERIKLADFKRLQGLLDESKSHYCNLVG